MLPKGLQFEWNGAEDLNYIDTHVHAKLRKLRINPRTICSDEEFLRRVTLDIVGTLPSVEEYQKFVADTDPTKRDKRGR